jgi:hypothetical protein
MIRIAGSCTALPAVILAALVVIEGHAQSTMPPSPAPNIPAGDTSTHAVALSLPVGTPLQVALDREVRVKKVGQPLQGHLLQPVYAFDHLVLPLGTKVQGHIATIGRPSGKALTFSILNAQFTPPRPIQVSFDEIVLADGRQMPLHVAVVPGSGQVMSLVDSASGRSGPAKHGVSAKISEAKQEWQQAMQQVKQPGKMHRALRMGQEQLPVHPQYIDAGTLYYADLQQPLDFGSEAVKAQELQSIGTPPPPGSLVRASLVTALNSGTTKHGASVQAVVSKPLFDGDRLILPQGTLLNGSVLQVRPARRMKHNGELRIAFHELVLPSGATFRVDTTLKAIQAAESLSPSLDQEGGAKATNPKSRYVNTGISVSLAMVGSGGKNDVGDAAGPAAGGATAFKLVGIAVGLAVRSHSLAILMSAYGGSRSIYTNFFGRGQDISFPKDTSMDIGFGDRTEAPMPVHP